MSQMKRSMPWLLMSALAGIGAIGLSGQAIAQTTPSSSSIDPQVWLGGTRDNSGNLFGGSSDPFDLIHRAILAPSVSQEEFRNQQQRQITSEADAFRLRQQEALREPTLGAEPSTEDVPGDTP
jgi:hypothetical protein